MYMYLQKVISKRTWGRKKNLIAVLKVTEEKRMILSRIRIRESEGRIRIRTKTSRIHNTARKGCGSKTLTWTGVAYP
jgi:hypothetical protein